MKISRQEADRLVADHYGLAKARVARFARRYPHLDRDELESRAMQALIKTPDLYDPKLATFGTYADRRITGYLRSYVRTQYKAAKRREEDGTTTVNSEEIAEVLPSDADHASDILDELQYEDTLENLFAQIPCAKYRDVVYRTLSGETRAAIGVEYGVSGSTISKWLKYARGSISKPIF